MPITHNSHSQAVGGAELRGWEYRKFADVAAMNLVTGRPGEICTVTATGDNFAWNATDAAWHPWFIEGSVLRQSITGAASVNVADRAAVELTMSGNVTGLTFTGWEAVSTKKQSVRVYALQDATGGRTFAWAGVAGIWTETPPETLPTAANSLVLEFEASTTDGGTTVRLGLLSSGYVTRYSFLKTAGGVINPAILADATAGRFNDSRRTSIEWSTYYADQTFGGGRGNVVPAGTGTNDNGRFIAIDASWQIRQLFGSAPASFSNFGARIASSNAATAIQAAFNSGLRHFTGDGQYRITAALVWPSNIVVEAANYQRANVTIRYLGADVPRVHDMRNITSTSVKGIAFAYDTGLTGTLVDLGGAGVVGFENCIFTAQDALQTHTSLLVSLGQATRVNFDRCLFSEADVLVRGNTLDVASSGFSNGHSFMDCSFAAYDTTAIRNAGQGWSFNGGTVDPDKTDALPRFIQQDVGYAGRGVSIMGMWLGDIIMTTSPSDEAWIRWRGEGLSLIGCFIGTGRAQVVRAEEQIMGLTMLGCSIESSHLVGVDVAVLDFTPAGASLSTNIFVAGCGIYPARTSAFFKNNVLPTSARWQDHLGVEHVVPAAPGTTPPVNVTVTGDGATTVFTVTHNLALTTPFLPSSITVLDPGGNILSGSSYQLSNALTNSFTVTFAVAPANAAVHTFRVTS